jgi:DNA repair protein RadC
VSGVDSSALTEKGPDRDSDRLRQQAVSPGPPSGDLSALESLLRFAIPGADVRPIAALLIQRFGTLETVLSAAPDEPGQLTGMTDASVNLLKLVDWINRRHVTIATARPEGHANAVERHPSVAPEVQSTLFPLARTTQLELALATQRAPAGEPKVASAVKGDSRRSPCGRCLGCEAVS